MSETSGPAPSFHITQAETPADLEEVRGLLRAYAATLGIDLAFQGFEEELAGLPGAYEPPAGALLIARSAEGPLLGCVALRSLAPDGCCEMRRLYVTPEGRGLGVGGALVDQVMGEARGEGYARMLLEALPGMEAALTLYRTRGFKAVPPFYDSPVEGAVFLECAL